MTETATHAGLALLASAIAGRTLRVEDADVAWTDGSTLYLPPSASHDDAVRAASVQASLLAAGSLSAAILPALRNKQRRRRYLAIEGARALEANEALLPIAARSLVDAPSGSDSPEASLRLAEHLPVDPPVLFGEIRPRDVEPDGVDLSDALSSVTVGRGGPIGRLLARMLESGRGQRGRGALADAPRERTWSADDNDEAPALFSTTPTRDDVTSLGATGTYYPEWDGLRNQYRPDWCNVVESEATDVAAAEPVGHLHAFTRALGRLEVGLAPVRRRAQGSDVDVDAAVERLVDVRAGGPRVDDVYVESLRRRRDLSVVVLLDVSGSAKEPGADGESVHHQQRRLAAALTATLHDLGDRVALYAFNSRGRDAVQMTRLKPFDAPMDVAALGRLAAVKPAAYTRLGAAIRHATHVAAHRSGTPRRLLVVISDGFAYDHGYEGEYAEADARRALDEARAASVGCVCLSVGGDTDAAALQRVFGSAAYARVTRVADAPEVIGPLFRAAMRRIR